MTPELKNFLIKQLRRISHKWRAFDEAKKRDRVDRAIDPATGRLCWRAQCVGFRELIFEKHRKMDHVEPVVPLSGWSTLDSFATRLFCEANNLQSLCKDCHDLKTADENRRRR